MDLQIFTNAEFGSVRTITKDGEPWFVGKDVAEALGFTNPRDAISTHVFDDDKGVERIDTLGGKQNMTIINESGLYALVFGSRLDSAKRFKHWVTSEVLPTIRKYKVYATDDMIDKMIDDPDLAIKAFTALKEERAKRKALETTVAAQSQQIAELTPKATYYDVVLRCKDAVNISVIAKDYGWSAQKMNEYLHDKGIQYKRGGIWLLYQKYAAMGYTKTFTNLYSDSKAITHAGVHTKWTQKGRLFIYELLKNDGVLPQLEIGRILPDSRNAVFCDLRH